MSGIESHDIHVPSLLLPLIRFDRALGIKLGGLSTDCWALPGLKNPLIVMG